jgi:hypothetical protein
MKFGTNVIPMSQPQIPHTSLRRSALSMGTTLVLRVQLSTVKISCQYASVNFRHPIK